MAASTPGNGSLNGAIAAENAFLKIVGNSVYRSTSSSVMLGPAPDTPNSPLVHNTLWMSIYPDPKLQFGMGSIKSLDIQTTIGGEVVKVDQNILFHLRKNSNNLCTSMGINLPKFGSGAVISRISGVARLRLANASELWKVSDLLNSPDAAKVIGGIEYVVDGASIKGNMLKLDISVFRAANEPRLDPDSIYANLLVRDGQRRALTNAFTGNSFSTEPDGRRRLRTELLITANLLKGVTPTGPFSLEWNIGTDMRTFDTPFELTGVKVP